jgi:hypothetical protein
MSWQWKGERHELVGSVCMKSIKHQPQDLQVFHPEAESCRDERTRICDVFGNEVNHHTLTRAICVESVSL